MAKIYEAGDKSQAICSHCEALVETTFAYRNLPFDDGSGTVEDVLAAVCDVCGHVASIPAQSTVAIRRARDIANIPLEVKLRVSEIDILDAAARQIDAGATTRFRKTLFTYFLNRLVSDLDALDHITSDFKTWSERRQVRYTQHQTPQRRLSFKLAPRTDDQIRLIRRHTGWPKTSLVRGIVMLVEQDILDNPSSSASHELKGIAAIVNA